MAALNSFPKFSHLPTELRLKIWSLAIKSLSPRLINLQLLYLTGTPPLQPPTLLQTNQESRSVALSTYQPWKRCPSEDPIPFTLNPSQRLSAAEDQKPTDIPYTYISPSRDIFMLTWCDLNYKRFGSFPDLALTSGRQRIWDIRERICHLLVPIGGIDRLFDEARARVALRELLKPFNSLSRFDVSINGVVHAEGVGWSVEGHAWEEIKGMMVDFVEDSQGGEGRRMMTVVEALRIVMGSIEGLRIPVVRAVSVVED